MQSSTRSTDSVRPMRAEPPASPDAPDAPDAPAAPLRSRAAQITAVLSLALGIFILITIEELPIGVLTIMSADLGVTPGITGLAVTLPGVIAALVALATPVVIGRMDRRLVLVIALASVVLSCVLSVLAPNIQVLLASRIFTGIAIGMYWSVLPVVATRQVAPQHRTRALTLAMSGTGAALVLGVPFTAWLGSAVGWRASFAVVAILAVVMLVAIALVVRPVRSDEAIRPADMARALRHRGVRYAAAMTGVIVTAQFITYSYVSPLLQERAHVSAGSIGAMLLAFGVAGLIGNFAVAPLLRRHPVLAVLTIALGIAGSLGVLALAVHGPLGAALVMPLWGAFAGAASVSIQSFVGRAAAEVEEPGTAINSAMFNVAIAAGAAIGGRIVDSLGLGATVATTVVLALVGAAICVRYLVRHARSDL